MTTFQEKLKDILGSQDSIPAPIEGLEDAFPRQSFNDHYTQPEMNILVENGKKLQNPKQIRDLEALFDPIASEGGADKPLICRVLIEGGAGVGKTVSLQCFAYEWSQGRLCQDKFNYVYRVPLKTLFNQDWNHIFDRQLEEEYDILKCLVYSHLAAELPIEERQHFKLENLPWKQEKTLLLIDGYDEVAHERKYQKVLEEIFDHKYIILTSRPNVINKKMAARFGRKIENTGFDHDGISQYLTRYFKNDKAKGLALEDLLQKNSSIQGICHIPVIIAMLCSIWCQGDSNKALLKVSNMSELYHQILNHIGFRNYARLQYNLGKSREELISQWRGGAIRLDEVRVLQYLAFIALIDGDIEGKDEQRPKTSIIRGMTERDDQTDISIQSAINHQSYQERRQMPPINQVCRFGLLKPEGVSLSDEKLSETDLQKLNWSFTHLSFQEFLTAMHLVEKLTDENNHEEQENIANFIARHRNEPRYLMTFIFMAGLLSAAKGKQAEQGIRIFWEAIMCNPDGVLELGVETKVILLMNLLSQTRKGGKIDKRIPHLHEAVKLIDSVVFGDLSGWKTQLRESDYTSDDIREGLIEYLLSGETDWFDKKSVELRNQINPNLKPITNEEISQASLDDIIDIIGGMIHKFPDDEVEDIVFKGLELLRNYNEAEWPRAKKVIELVIMINRKANIKETHKTEVFHCLLNTISDNNLNEISSKALQELICKHQNSSLAVLLLKIIREGLLNITTEIQYQRMWTEVKLAMKCGLCETDFAREIISLLARLLNSENKGIRNLTSTNFTELIEILSKDKICLAGQAVNMLIPILEDLRGSPNIKISTSETIISLMKFSDKNNIRLFRNVLRALNSFLQNPEKKFTNLISNKIQEFVMISSNRDPLLIQNALKIFRNLLQDADKSKEKNQDPNTIKEKDEDDSSSVKLSASKNLIELLKRSECNNEGLFTDMLKILIDLLKNDDPGISTSASTTLQDFLKVKIGLIENAINDLVPNLEAPKHHVRKNSFNTIIELLQASNNDMRTQLAQNLLDKLIKYWKNPVLDGRKRALEIIIELLKIIGNKSSELIKALIEIMTPFLADIAPESIISASDCITEVVSGNSKLVREAIKSFQSILKTSHTSVRKTTSKNICLLVIRSKERDSRLMDDIIANLLEFSKNSEWSVKTSVAEIIISLMNRSGRCDPDLVQKILDILAPILMDRRDDARKAASDNLTDLMNVKGNHLFREIIKTLVPLVQSSDDSISEIGQFTIMELFKMSGNNKLKVIQGILNPLRDPLSLSNKSQDVKTLVSKTIIKLMIIGDTNNIQLVEYVLGMFKPLLSYSKFLHDLGWSSTNLASSSIIEVMNKSRNRDPQLIENMMNTLTQFLKNSDPIIRISTSQYMTELVKLVGSNDNNETLKKLIQLLQDTERDVKASASHNIIEILEISGSSCGDNELCKTIFNILSPLLQVRNSDMSTSVSNDMIKLAMIDNHNDLVRDVMNALILAPRLRDLNMNAITVISKNMTNLLKVKSKNDANLASEIIDIMAPYLQHANKNLVEMSSSVLKEAFLIEMEHPISLQQYFKKQSSKQRDVLTSVLLDCLRTYVQSFHSLGKLFQDPKTYLTLANITQLLNEVYNSEIPERISQQVETYLEDFKNTNFSNELLSRLKSFLVSELNQIGSLKGPQIIELALIITSKEKEPKNSSGHQELIELAKEALNIQVRYLDDDGLRWIYKKHYRSLSLSPETKPFYRKVCHKMLEDFVITPLEERLIIKFINQGLTIALTRSGEVIFEGKCYKLKGADIWQSLEKIAKTIIQQQEDILAQQYKENNPIFGKKHTRRKEAAADRKEVRSIVDSRFLLKNDSWLLTILSPKISLSEIIILEHRSAFGDHFIYHFSKKLYLRYPNETPELTEIFGTYELGERYRAEMKELIEKTGQDLFESKDRSKIYQIDGEIISNQIYFQQELLRIGSEDRNKETEEDLETKLIDNRMVLQKTLRTLGLEKFQKRLIWEYSEGLTSAFCAVYISALAITVGKIAVDDGADFFSLTNLFKQLCSFAPFGIGGPLFDTVDAVRKYLKGSFIKKQANYVKDIAIDTVESSDLVGRIIQGFIATPESRQRIFNARNDDQVHGWLKKVKSWVLEQFDKLKQKLRKCGKLRRLLEEQMTTTPAFQLGVNHANRIIQRWIELKDSNSSLRMSPDEKYRIFLQAIVAN